jgi:hypothetical protein
VVLLADFGLAELQPGRLWWKRSDTTAEPPIRPWPATLGQVERVPYPHGMKFLPQAPASQRIDQEAPARRL